MRIAQWLSAWSCLGKAMGAVSRCRFDPCPFHLSICFHVFCQSRARSRFVVHFSKLFIFLFTVTCIFKSLGLAPSVSASIVVLTALFISILSFMNKIEPIFERAEQLRGFWCRAVQCNNLNVKCTFTYLGGKRKRLFANLLILGTSNFKFILQFIFIRWHLNL